VDSAPKALALSADLEGAWGAEESTAEDIIIPKLLLMHGQSEKVLQGEKTQGDLVRSTDWQTVAKRGETVTIIPFKMFKTWRVSEIVDGQAEWRREEPWTASNTDLEWDFTENGKPMRRDQAYNFYVILTDDIGKTDMPFPIKLQFVRTSRKAGKVLADHFAKCNMFRRPPALQTFEIGSEFINGEKQKYFVFTAKAGEASTIEQVTAAKQWYDLIQKAGGQVKEHDVKETTTVGINEETAEF
jgi:hypothetical protein